MNCKHCQSPLDDGVTICPSCGFDNAETAGDAIPAPETQEATPAAEAPEATAAAETPAPADVPGQKK